MQYLRPSNNTPDDQNNMAVASQIVSKTEQYVAVYDKLRVEPTKFELRLEAIGLGMIARRRRLDRIRRRTRTMGTLEQDARSLLGDAIALAKNSEDTATRLSYQALGALHTERPRMETIRHLLDSMLEDCKETLTFVRKYSRNSFPEHHIDWVQVDINTIGELKGMDLDDRTRIQEQWRVYIELLQEHHQLLASVEYNDTLWKWANYLRDLSSHFTNAYSVELSRISDRFALYSVLLDLADLQALDQFAEQESDIVYPLAEVIRDLGAIKGKLREYSKMFRQGK